MPNDVLFVKINPFLLGVCLLKFSILEIFNGRFLVKVQDKNHVLKMLSFGSG